MRKTLLLVVAAAVCAGLAQNAAADSFTWAQEVTERGYDVGVPNARDCQASVLGSPTEVPAAGCEKFVSLGVDGTDADSYGGWVVLDFGTWFDHAAIVFETTNNCAPGPNGCPGYLEAAEVWASATQTSWNALGDWFRLGTVPNATAQNGAPVLFAGGPFRYLAVIDATRIVYPSETTSGRDGFDLNAVGVTAVPEPASMLLLGSGLVAAARASRRRRLR